MKNLKLSLVVFFHLVTPFWNPNHDRTLDGINWMMIFETLFDAPLGLSNFNGDR